MPIRDFYEALALVAFFLLLIAFLSSPKSGVVNFQPPARLSLCIYQFPAVMAVVAVVTEITQATGRYCAESKKPQFAHIWLQVISIGSTILAIVSLLKFYKAHSKEMTSQKPLSKFIAFKGIVFLNFLQTVRIVSQSCLSLKERVN
jgi:D-alanyl-lipoteichoic acid acyltransferase DltB (MBOAT superfamily)